MSLRLRLALTAALLTLGGVGVGLAVTYGVLVTGSNLSFDRESTILAEVIHEAVLLRSETTIRVPAVVESYLTTESGVRSAQVFLDGQLLWEGGVVDGPRPLDPNGLVEGKGARTVSGWRVVSLYDPADGITVQVGRPLAGLRETLAPFAWLALPLTLLLAAVAGVLGWLGAGVALRPLRTLTTAVSDISDRGRVPQIGGSDEPARLAAAFSDLWDRLGEQRKREHDFLAYAAHELRTPLSALRASLDLARAQGGVISTETLERLRKEAARLESMSQNLLALSRAEADEAQFAVVDLAEIAAASYDRFLPLALEKGLELQLAGGPVPVRADDRLLSQALDNLVHNAIRATATGSIEIWSGLYPARGDPHAPATAATRACLSVSDSGRGFPAEVREGLGLRVVRAVMRAHDGEAQVGRDGGTVVRLLLPQR